MTLVVFQKIDEHIFICADMKMLWNQVNSQPENIDSWRPKVIIIRKDLAICWAGELVFAEEALKEIWNKRLGITFEDLKSIAIKHHDASRVRGEVTDFIVSDTEGNSCKIIKGNCYNLIGDCFDYIGDDDLYQNYLKATDFDLKIDNRFVFKIFRISDANTPNYPGNLGRTNSKMINSSELYHIENKLGHVTTPVSGNKTKGFSYNLHLLIDTISSLPKNVNTWENIDLGSLEVGSYSFQITSLKEDGHQILIYQNLYNKQKYFFGDFGNGVPKLNKERLILPP